MVYQNHDNHGWVTTSYNGWPNLNLQAIEQEFGDPEAWKEWILSHFDEEEKEDVSATIDAYLSRQVAPAQLLQEQENGIPQQFGDPEAWEQWVGGHFSHDDPRNAEEAA